MKYMGPFTFNGVRFALGAIALIPFLGIGGRRLPWRKVIYPGTLAGLFIFLGVSFQQVGLLYTSAGKAGFITGLYVILVPILGLIVGKRTSLPVWAGAALASVGMYFLSIQGKVTVNRGDLLVLAGALFWAIQIHIIGKFSPKLPPIKLAMVEFWTVSLFSLGMALLAEKISIQGILHGWAPILYAGIFSSGIAYTIQVVAQRKAPPSPAAVIMSLESVFAALGGWIFLGEVLTAKETLGCLLMFGGMVLAQLELKG